MDIGAKVKAIRNRKKITIAQLCEGTGLSKGFVSNIENNNTSPSINTLQAIANFLDVPLPYLLLEKKQHMRVVKKAERTHSNHNELTIEHLGSFGNLRMMSVGIAPGASIGKENAHEGIECHIVLEGKILASQGEDLAELEEGDTFSWHASVPHFVKNIGAEKAIILIAVYTDQEIGDKY